MLSFAREKLNYWIITNFCSKCNKNRRNWSFSWKNKDLFSQKTKSDSNWNNFRLKSFKKAVLKLLNQFKNKNQHWKKTFSRSQQLHFRRRPFFVKGALLRNQVRIQRISVLSTRIQTWWNKSIVCGKRKRIHVGTQRKLIFNRKVKFSANLPNKTTLILLMQWKSTQIWLFKR